MRRSTTTPHRYYDDHSWATPASAAAAYVVASPSSARSMMTPRTSNRASVSKESAYYDLSDADADDYRFPGYQEEKKWDHPSSFNNGALGKSGSYSNHRDSRRDGHSYDYNYNKASNGNGRRYVRSCNTSVATDQAVYDNDAEFVYDLTYVPSKDEEDLDVEEPYETPATRAPTTSTAIANKRSYQPTTPQLPASYYNPQMSPMLLTPMPVSYQYYPSRDRSQPSPYLGQQYQNRFPHLERKEESQPQMNLSYGKASLMGVAKPNYKYSSQGRQNPKHGSATGASRRPMLSYGNSQAYSAMTKTMTAIQLVESIDDNISLNSPIVSKRALEPPPIVRRDIHRRHRLGPSSPQPPIHGALSVDSLTQRIKQYSHKHTSKDSHKRSSAPQRPSPYNCSPRQITEKAPKQTHDPVGRKMGGGVPSPASVRSLKSGTTVSSTGGLLVDSASSSKKLRNIKISFSKDSAVSEISATPRPPIRVPIVSLPSVEPVHALFQNRKAPTPKDKDKEQALKDKLKRAMDLPCCSTIQVDEEEEDACSDNTAGAVATEQSEESVWEEDARSDTSTAGEECAKEFTLSSPSALDDPPGDMEQTASLIFNPDEDNATIESAPAPIHKPSRIRMVLFSDPPGSQKTGAQGELANRAKKDDKEGKTKSTIHQKSKPESQNSIASEKIAEPPRTMTSIAARALKNRKKARKTHKAEEAVTPEHHQEPPPTKGQKSDHTDLFQVLLEAEKVLAVTEQGLQQQYRKRQASILSEATDIVDGSYSGAERGLKTVKDPPANSAAAGNEPIEEEVDEHRPSGNESETSPQGLDNSLLVDFTDTVTDIDCSGISDQNDELASDGNKITMLTSLLSSWDQAAQEDQVQLGDANRPIVINEDHRLQSVRSDDMSEGSAAASLLSHLLSDDDEACVNMSSVPYFVVNETTAAAALEPATPREIQIKNSMSSDEIYCDSGSYTKPTQNDQDDDDNSEEGVMISIHHAAMDDASNITDENGTINSESIIRFASLPPNPPPKATAGGVESSWEEETVQSLNSAGETTDQMFTEEEIIEDSEYEEVVVADDAKRDEPDEIHASQDRDSDSVDREEGGTPLREELRPLPKPSSHPRKKVSFNGFVETIVISDTEQSPRSAKEVSASTSSFLDDALNAWNAKIVASEAKIHQLGSLPKNKPIHFKKRAKNALIQAAHNGSLVQLMQGARDKTLEDEKKWADEETLLFIRKQEAKIVFAQAAHAGATLTMMAQAEHEHAQEITRREEAAKLRNAHHAHARWVFTEAATRAIDRLRRVHPEYDELDASHRSLSSDMLEQILREQEKVLAQVARLAKFAKIKVPGLDETKENVTTVAATDSRWTSLPADIVSFLNELKSTKLGNLPTTAATAQQSDSGVAKEGPGQGDVSNTAPPIAAFTMESSLADKEDEDNDRVGHEIIIKVRSNDEEQEDAADGDSVGQALSDVDLTECNDLTPATPAAATQASTFSFMYDYDDDANSDSELTATLDMERLQELVTSLMTHEYGFDFSSPVDLQEFPDYCRLIVGRHGSKPMDLGTILRNLIHGSYETILEFQEDVNRVFDNAMAYNPPGSKLHTSARTLKRIFDVELLKLLDQLELELMRQRGETKDDLVSSHRTL